MVKNKGLKLVPDVECKNCYLRENCKPYCGRYDKSKSFNIRMEI